MTVLILARDFDPTADAVVRALTRDGVPVFRTDLADFPSLLRLEAVLRRGQWSGSLGNAHHRVELAEIRSVWNRHPSGYRLDPSLPPRHRDFCDQEATLGLGGVLASLDVLWANHPHRCADAVSKPCQWRVAAECGLAVADTVITNDPAAAAEFARHAEHGVIIKALGASGITEDAEPRIAYTRRLTGDDLADLSAVALTATTVQRFVPKSFEVRLTVIGRAWFPIAIHATTEATRVDWRCDPSALWYEMVPIPEDVVSGVGAYLERMHLRYAGLDFVVTPDDEWVLLEANTGPQFGWLEAATGAPMTEAMATMLAGAG